MSRIGPPGAPLTAAEIAVLELAAEGYTTNQIAKRLHIGREAVLHRVTSARNKLGARDRTHTVVLAYRTGQLGLANGTDRLAAAQALVRQLHTILGQPRSAA
ncbi:MAG: helix-turn-helix transcriptional regulator [Catenulispora sp.]|nr:helix-turn-helix transcriptional regulator [Catenulispora sp.]NUS29140.1 helix-turn-helix transcriptional regulator [Streptomyces sp.]